MVPFLVSNPAPQVTAPTSPTPSALFPLPQAFGLLPELPVLSQIGFVGSLLDCYIPSKEGTMSKARFVKGLFFLRNESGIMV